MFKFALPKSKLIALTTISTLRKLFSAFGRKSRPLHICFMRKFTCIFLPAILPKPTRCLFYKRLSIISIWPIICKFGCKFWMVVSALLTKFAFIFLIAQIVEKLTFLSLFEVTAVIYEPTKRWLIFEL